MPSGAKKRKAAKKKLEKQSNNFIKDSNNGSHSNSNKGSDEPKFHDERDSDSGDVEREGNVESSVNNNDDEGAKEVSFDEGNVTEVKQQEESFEDVIVHADEVAREFQSVTSKSTSSSRSNSNSSSSLSSGDDEVVVEKESLEPESGKVEPLDEALSEEVVAPADDVEEASVENSVEEFIESIPKEESLKEVVSLPEESTAVNENVPVDDWSTFDVVSSEFKQNVDEVLQSFEKTVVASGVIDLVEEKIEGKTMPVVDVSPENTSEHVVVTTRNDEEVLPQSSGVKAVEVEDNGKTSETHKHTEEQPLLPSAPVTVRSTSWMNCCGLLEVFSGGSN